MSKLLMWAKALSRWILTTIIAFVQRLTGRFKRHLEPANTVEPSSRPNIFSDPDWQNYDYQHDMATDPELQPLSPVGREHLE
ncbi:hypothetical protein [Lactiplantibacillus pentosus]|uniref:hypothetical protein n=1 Tax=Lactiplantibacillus pentosus TaxID=1589 RepID=UPI0013C52768|nr:hypothetical protein [Lactiplantibacillus pentosus]MCJ8180184.1 hypothetical protein [Lactiplantibacillus pentosus]MCS8602810.1 hypothetical protein [Lactiplantibacillus pentosus]